MVFMSNENQKKMYTADAIKYNKDCCDFTCLNDGTIYRECKYCNLSLQCQQVDMVGTKPISMESHYCPVVDPTTQEIVEWEYYCTGKHDNRPLDERKDNDDKIS